MGEEHSRKERQAHCETCDCHGGSSMADSDMNASEGVFVESGLVDCVAKIEHMFDTDEHRDEGQPQVEGRSLFPDVIEQTEA